MSGASRQGPARARTLARRLVGPVLVTALLAIYLVALGWRGVTLVGTGDPVGVALGLAILVLPVLAAVFLAREWLLAARVQTMADELAAAGALPVDDLPRSPGGRVDRAAADAAFAEARAACEAAPQDWRTWFALGFAYDAARDRPAARAALRRADRLRRNPG